MTHLASEPLTARLIHSPTVRKATSPGAGDLAVAPIATHPARLDRLAVRAISAAVSTEGTCELGAYHGLEVLGLVHQVLEYSSNQQAARFGNGNQQRLLGALLNYRRFFTPDERWALVGANENAATLTWECRTTDLPLVVDQITRTSVLARTASNLGQPETRSDVVVRSCDLNSPKDSLLQFPDEPRTTTWCVSDDPIFMRELAFPSTAHSQAYTGSPGDYFCSGESTP